MKVNPGSDRSKVNIALVLNTDSFKYLRRNSLKQISPIRTEKMPIIYHS